jgi:hypothetical protein
MEVIGVIKLKGDVQTFGADFTKRQLVVNTTEQYPQFIAIDFVKDKCSLLDSYKVGDSVKVSINLGGREWVNPQGEAKYFNSITGWRIELLEDDNDVEVPDLLVPPSRKITAEQLEEDADDLPFN